MNTRHRPRGAYQPRTPASRRSRGGAFAGLAVAALALPAMANGGHDDHGDGPRTATVLEIGSAVAGTVSTGDMDVFRFDLVGQAAVVIRTSGPNDTSGELTDSAGTSLATDEDSGAGDNFSITQDLSGGIYYVHVSGSGDYAVDVRVGADRADLHGDTLESATLLRLLSDAELAAVSPQALLMTSGRIGPAADDVDVFRVDVPYSGTDVVMRGAGGANVNGSLVDSSDMAVASDSGNGNFHIATTLAAGIYYLKVTAAAPGSYRVLAQGSGADDDSAAEDRDSDGDGVIDSRDAFPNDASESEDRDANGVGDNAHPIASTYMYDSAFSADASSVSYSGQTARQMLISAMKAELGGLSEDVGMEDSVKARLNFYITGDGVDDTPHNFTVAGGEPVKPGPTYGDVSTGKNLGSKTAGQDKAEHVLGGEFFGWDALDAGAMPIDLVNHFIDSVSVEASDGNSPLISTVGGDVSLDVVYVDAHGRDYQQLVQKFLGGAVAFSQGTADYLSTDWHEYLTRIDGKDYTGAEHKFDEAFGYYGAARNMNEYTDDEAAAKGGRDGWGNGYHDTDGDGVIDLRSEFVFGHAQNCAKRDRGSNGMTDFSMEAMSAFLLGRQIVGNAAMAGSLSAEAEQALDEQIKIATVTWEKCIAATVVHYINDVMGDMDGFDDGSFADLAGFKNLAKHWGEMKGFALGLQFSPFSPFRDGSVDGITVDSLKEVLRLMDDAPVLADGSQGGVMPSGSASDAVMDYTADLLEARDILEKAYGFDHDVVMNW
ncbi:MAG: DUF4856 domain-containing protein [Gammaproteobacteria bacterium]|nr:DUF4856 domain-containing protein [Gammaproteobacteria bacterium]